jgi:preprotein translocase subunit YajC
MTTSTNNQIKTSNSAATVTTQASSLQPQLPVPPKPNIFLQAIPLVVIFVFFYFFIIRPQKRKMKEISQMLSSVKIGSKVLTSAGIYATVIELDDKAGLAKVEIAKNVRISITKSSIVSILSHEDLPTSNS